MKKRKVVRKRKHYRFRRRHRGSINLKEVERSRPWQVCVEYEIKRGYSPGGPAFDRGTLFAVAGRYSDSSGAGGGIRDHQWDCSTIKEAEALAAKLATVPGLTHLAIHGDVYADMLRKLVETAKKKKLLHRFPDGTAAFIHGRRHRPARRRKHLRRRG